MSERKQRPSGFWNSFDNCEKAALECETLEEFKRKYSGAYHKSVEKGFIDKFTWLKRKKPVGFWDEKENVLEEGKKYETRTEFAKNNPSAYCAAIKNNWIDECGFKSEKEARSEAASKPRKWIDKETCHKAAMQCKSRTEFQHKFSGAWAIANKEGWLDEWFAPLRKERTYERFMEIAEGCTTKGQIQDIDASLYQKAREEGWFKDTPWIIDHVYNPRKWTDEKRWEAARHCSTRSEYMHRFVGAYTYDKDHGLLDRYTHFVKPIAEGRDPNAEDYVIYAYRDYINKCVYVGLTYEERKKKRHDEHRLGRMENGVKIFDVVAKHFQSIGQELPEPIYHMEGLHINDVGHFEGWYMEQYEKDGWKLLNLAPAGSLGGAKVKWTYNACKEDSKKYTTRSQWKTANSPAYYKAVRTCTEDGIRWIDTFCWLQDPHTTRSKAAKKRQTGRKLSDEHKKNISKAVKSFYTNKRSYSFA